MKKIVAFFLCLSFSLLFIGCASAKVAQTESPGNTAEMGAPVYFYLNGSMYCHHGQIAKALPEGYVYAGEVKVVGGAFTGNDFEGNAEGTVYMNDSVSDTAYFSWAEWDEEIDGPAPFLKLELEQK